jgi:anti-sigma B factor antagonist
MALNIKLKEKEPGVFLVTLEGIIDTATTSEFEKTINGIIDSKAVILDMKKMTYITSMGLGAIFKIKKSLESRKGILVISNLQPNVQKVFELVKAIPEHVFTSLEEADTYLDNYLADQIKDSESLP